MAGKTLTGDLFLKTNVGGETGTPVIVGASLTLVRFTVTVWLVDKAPPSCTDIVNEKLGVVSKSSADGVLTVSSPVVALIWNALFVLPPVML